MQNRIWKGMAMLTALLLLLASGCGKAEEESGNTPTIGYAYDGVTIVDEQEDAEEVLRKMQEEADKSSISLSFKNQAFSTDGINFDCYLANPTENPYDMYIQIFADQAMTDEVFLSGLLRPGTAFETIALNHELNAGTHTGVCIFTLVDTAEDGTQTMMKQSSVEIQLFVADV